MCFSRAGFTLAGLGTLVAGAATNANTSARMASGTNRPIRCMAPPLGPVGSALGRLPLPTTAPGTVHIGAAATTSSLSAEPQPADGSKATSKQTDPRINGEWAGGSTRQSAAEPGLDR